MKSSQVTIGILYALAAYYAIEDQYWKALHAVLIALAFTAGAIVSAGGGNRMSAIDNLVTTPTAFAVACIGLFVCMVGLMVAGVQLGEFGVRWMRRKVGR